ncbi:MAG: hypothetical protein Fur006_17020 [Coleofasciculaceae cyanobacterium]
MTISQKFPVPSSKLFVWVFIPYCIQGQKLISEEYDNPATHQELADVFAELGVAWKWQPITLENMHAVVEEVAASSNEYIPLVLNYCDGLDEIDGYPGVSVVKLLEAKSIIFTGVDACFYNLCDSKILMKRTFVGAGVATAPYEVVDSDKSIQGVCDRLGTPLIVKPAMSMGARGLSLQSVVYSDDQIRQQIQWLVQGTHDIQFTQENIFVERFINGREFTVFLIGSANHPDDIKIYPPLEKYFNSNLPEIERFFTYDLYHLGMDGRRTTLPPEEPLFECRLVTPDLCNRLSDLAKRAYCSVSANGYGRVDIRMDKNSQDLFVLEVNPNCAISSIPLPKSAEEGATSVGTILHLAGIPFAQLMSEMIAEAFARHSTHCAA